jgi:hypothetical protein
MQSHFLDLDVLIYTELMEQKQKKVLGERKVTSATRYFGTA